MQQALTSPVARAVFVGGLLVAATLAAPADRPRCACKAGAHRGVRLVLKTVARPGAVYLSWWNDGDVRLDLTRDLARDLTPGELPVLRFTTRAQGSDGCRWKGIETLEPIDARHYAYRYDEVLLSCRPGARPFDKTPRTGVVTVLAD